MSSLIASINLLLSIPRFLFPGSSIVSILLPTYPAYFLSACPNHPSLAYRSFSPNGLTCTVNLMYSFLILLLLTKILTSSTLQPPHPVFSSAPQSPARAGLTATLYTSPFTPACNRLSQITPEIILHQLHPACTLFVNSLPHSPLLCKVDPSYLKSSTFATSSP